MIVAPALSPPPYLSNPPAPATGRAFVRSFVVRVQYGFVKQSLTPAAVDGEEAIIPDQVVQLAAGGIAGCASWLPPIYCVDVIKTRMQTARPGQYTSTWDCVVKTWRWAYCTCSRVVEWSGVENLLAAIIRVFRGFWPPPFLKIAIKQRGVQAVTGRLQGYKYIRV